MSHCDFYWGTHGCDLDPGHKQPHQCGPVDIKANPELGSPEPAGGHSQFDESTGLARFYWWSNEYPEGRWGDWETGWTGFRMND